MKFMEIPFAFNKTRQIICDAGVWDIVLANIEQTSDENTHVYLRVPVIDKEGERNLSWNRVWIDLSQHAPKKPAWVYQECQRYFFFNFLVFFLHSDTNEKNSFIQIHRHTNYEFISVVTSDCSRGKNEISSCICNFSVHQSVSYSCKIQW